MIITNIHQAKSQLSKLIERVQQGEEIIIGKAGKPVAKLVPYRENRKPRKPGGRWKGKIWMAPDFDELPLTVAPHSGARRNEAPPRHSHVTLVARRRSQAPRGSARSDRQFRE